MAVLLKSVAMTSSLFFAGQESSSQVYPSVIGKERGALLIRGRLGAAAERQVPAHHGGDGDEDGQDEEHGHDGEGKDPLEGDDLVAELCHAQRGGEDAQVEAHGVVL